MGYHIKQIPKGVLGEISKIKEELIELEDAFEQNAKILQLCELSDIIGAIQAFLQVHHVGTSLNDLIKMAELTKSAFNDGTR